jgi:hypothetical protein
MNKPPPPLVLPRLNAVDASKKSSKTVAAAKLASFEAETFYAGIQPLSMQQQQRASSAKPSRPVSSSLALNRVESFDSSEDSTTKKLRKKKNKLLSMLPASDVVITNLNEQKVKVIKKTAKIRHGHRKFKSKAGSVDIDETVEEVLDEEEAAKLKKRSTSELFLTKTLIDDDTRVLERARLFEIPQQSVMKFMSLISKSKWIEASKICKQCIFFSLSLYG